MLVRVCAKCVLCAASPNVADIRTKDKISTYGIVDLIHHAIISGSNLARGHDLLVANLSAEISVADLVQTHSVKLPSAINSVILVQ